MAAMSKYEMGLEKGRQSELKTIEAIKELMAEKWEHKGFKINQYRSTPSHGDFDKNGIDIIVIFLHETGWPLHLFFQVKSSQAGLDAHYKKGRTIPAVANNPNFPPLKEQIEAISKLYIEKKVVFIKNGKADKWFKNLEDGAKQFQEKNSKRIDQVVRECHENNPDFTKTEIVKATGLTYESVGKSCKRLGIKLRDGYQAKSERLDQAVRECHENNPDFTHTEIVKATGYGKVAVCKSCKRQGIKLKTHHPSAVDTKMKVYACLDENPAASLMQIVYTASVGRCSALKYRKQYFTEKAL